MPLIETIDMNDDDTTDCFQVTLTRSPLHGFGIAISGGGANENNPYLNEIDDQSLIISDIIKNGPADGKLLPNDRIVNVNGHPVVCSMEYTALKLIRESTDFVNLIVQRRKHPVVVSNNEPPMKCILSKTRKDEKFGIILDCRYFIKKIHYKNNEMFTNIQEGDEVIKINETPIDRLTLHEAQKLIDKTKERVVLYTVPNQFENEINHHQEVISGRKQLQSEYNQHIFERSSSNRQDFIRPSPGTRYVSFFTDTSSMGIRLAGGDKYGLFICEIQPNSVAHKAGLIVADKIFSVNNINFTSLTREEAVLYLMNMKTCEVNMIVSNLQNEYEQLLSDVGGDSFYIRTHFTYNSTDDEELSIRINDIFHVTDTLYNGQVGSWVATKLNKNSSSNKITGAIPNKSRAEQLANAAPSLGEIIKSKQPSFRRKLRSKFSDKRSRSVLSLNHCKEDSIFEKIPCWKPMTDSKFPTYERVRLKSVTIIRPVVLLGPLADIARDQLLEEYPDQFELPHVHLQSSVKARANIIKLQSIKHVIQRNRHCLLDITPTAIEQLNYAECYPIVIYFKAFDRREIKRIRNEYGKLYQKSSRRLFESSEQLEYFYSYLFTSIIKLDLSINWYEKLKSEIKFQQEQPIWMSHDYSADRDLLKSNEYFISTRLSYSDDISIRDQSSPNTHVTNRYDNKEKNYLQRVASDPAMFKKEKIVKMYSNDFANEKESAFMQNSTMSLPNRTYSVMEIPTNDSEQSQRRSDSLYPTNPLSYQRSSSHIKTINNQLFRTDVDRNSSSLNYHSQGLYSQEKNFENKPKIMSTGSSKINTNELPSNRVPLIAPKLRTINSNEQLSSSDSNGSMTKAEKNSAINLYATWNRSVPSRPTILPSYSNGLNHIDPSDRVTRCNGRIPFVDSNEKLRKESLLKQKMCNYTLPSDPVKSQSLSTSSNRHEFPLQKPRVYTYDDRNFPIPQQNILSSSSGSSTLSIKDKTIREVGETRSYSIQDGRHVIGSARGIMDYYGGKLSCPLTGVSLSVPIGAIPEGIEQEIYFQVCQDNSTNRKFNGELLSPIVLCGPHGTQFSRPIELILPHTAGTDAQEVSLMLHGTNQNSKINYLREENKSMIMNGINHVTSSNVSILVDHF